MLHSKSPIIRRKAKRKVQYCKTVKWAKRVYNCIKIEKITLGRRFGASKYIHDSVVVDSLFYVTPLFVGVLPLIFVLLFNA